MLIAVGLLTWILLVVALGVRAMRSAVEPPSAQCFDCDRMSCSGCAYIESSQPPRPLLQLLDEDERKLAA